MNKVQIEQITTNELVNLILEKVREQLQEFSQTSNQETENSNPHLTRLETAKYFGISPNCLNDWCNL